ncbi:MAG: GNAT family N-acetyltransferase [Spirochaetaceae bacterium]|nr:GNAT family N-acetyltransferase [Spirochaetaceae bacterium]
MILIRKAVKEDASVIENLYTELEKDGVFYQPEHFVLSKTGERSQQLESILSSDSQVMFVAENNGRVIGFAHVLFAKSKPFSCLKPQSNIYLQDLVVTESCRNRGFGTQLLNAAKQYGIEKGADFFRTQVFPGNVAGLRFYERNGFSTKMITIESPLK